MLAQVANVLEIIMDPVHFAGLLPQAKQFRSTIPPVWLWLPDAQIVQHW